MTITVTTAPPAAEQIPDLLLHDNPSEVTFDQLLIKVGQKIIDSELRHQFLPMTQVAALCRKYRIRWQYGTTKAKNLEMHATEYFRKNCELLSHGIKVEFSIIFTPEKRNPKSFLRFKKILADGSCAGPI